MKAIAQVHFAPTETQIAYAVHDLLRAAGVGGRVSLREFADGYTIALYPSTEDASAATMADLAASLAAVTVEQ